MTGRTTDSPARMPGAPHDELLERAAGVLERAVRARHSGRILAVAAWLRREAASMAKARVGATVEFEAWWAEYPKRKGTNGKQAAVRKYVSLRRTVSASELLAGVRRYAAYCAHHAMVGTPYVMQASRFLGPDAYWREAWPLDESGSADALAALLEEAGA